MTTLHAMLLLTKRKNQSRFPADSMAETSPNPHVCQCWAGSVPFQLWAMVRRQSRELCLLEHHDGSKKVLGRQHKLLVRCYAVLFYILSFMYEILVKFSNNKTSVALLRFVPMSENLQTENLGAWIQVFAIESYCQSIQQTNISTRLPNSRTSRSFRILSQN